MAEAEPGPSPAMRETMQATRSVLGMCAPHSCQWREGRHTLPTPQKSDPAHAAHGKEDTCAHTEHGEPSCRRMTHRPTSHDPLADRTSQSPALSPSSWLPLFPSLPSRRWCPPVTHAERRRLVGQSKTHPTATLKEEQRSRTRPRGTGVVGMGG